MGILSKVGSVVVAAATALAFALIPSGAYALGTEPPVQRIEGSNTHLAGSCDIAFGSDDKIYIANGAWSGGTPSVTVYAADATGNVAPIQEISGVNTGFSNPCGIAVDSTYVYVSDLNGSLFLFPLAATGDVAPVHTYSGFGMLFGMDLSESGDLAIGFDSGVIVFPDVAQATGTSQQFTNAATTKWTYDVAWDSSGGLYAAQSSDWTVIYMAPGAAVGDAPNQSMTITAASAEPYGVAVRPHTGEVLVADINNKSITGWSGSIDGSPGGDFEFSGSGTTINPGPSGIAFGSDNRFGVVLYGSSADAVLIFDAAATGDPMATDDGASSGSSSSAELANTGIDAHALTGLGLFAALVGAAAMFLARRGRTSTNRG
jgi:LPXTG-motif cell wall-anchored protein